MSTISERMEVDSSVDVPTMSLDSSLISSGACQMPTIDEDSALSDNCMTVKRIINILDQLDTQTESVRQEAAKLQEKRDAILMSLDVIKTNQSVANLDEYEQEEIACHVQRINNRLGTIELSVKTVRDTDQEDSLHQLNGFIDSVIVLNDRVQARHRCQLFLNCCDDNITATTGDTDEQIMDQQFRSFLVKCTLDDQKQIRKRLVALNTYLNKQTISD